MKLFMRQNTSIKYCLFGKFIAQPGRRDELLAILLQAA